MSPILMLALLGGGGYLLFRESPKSAAKKSEAPADAANLFAAMLAPSVNSVDTLRTAYEYMRTASGNLDGMAALRVAQYGLVFFLKACMLAKGAQPNAAELMAIGSAPLEGGVGLISYGDAGIDQMQAAAAALAPSYTDMAGLGTYIEAIAKVSQTKRTVAYLLALKAKQMALQDPVQFIGTVTIPPQCFFAIANLPAAQVPATAANSILAY